MEDSHNFNFIGRNYQSTSEVTKFLPDIKNQYESTPNYMNPKYPSSMVKVNMGLNGSMYSFEHGQRQKRYLKMGDRNRTHALNMISNIKKMQDYENQAQFDVTNDTQRSLRKSEKTIYSRKQKYGGKSTVAPTHFTSDPEFKPLADYRKTASQAKISKIDDIIPKSENHVKFKPEARQRKIFRSQIPTADEPKRERNLGLLSLDSAVNFLQRSQTNKQSQVFGTNHSSVRKLPQVDFDEFTFEKIDGKIKKYLHAKNLDISGQFAFTRPTLCDFVEQTYNLKLSKQVSTEAIFACRGKALEASDPRTEYDAQKLTQWLVKNLPSFVQLDKIKKQRAQQKAEEQRSRANAIIQQSGPDAIGIVNQLDGINPLDQDSADGDESNPDGATKQVGRSKFINISQTQEQNYGRNNLRAAQELKNKIDDCLDQAQKKPSIRKQILESLSGLEDQLNDIRAEEGFMAQMKAQQRLRDNFKATREKEDRDLENILERTAVLDSAVRAVSLQKLLTRQWNEEKNAYVILSKLDQKQQNKLNDMLFNRYDNI